MYHYRHRLVICRNLTASLLIFICFFSGVASAALSGIDPGYPRFTSTKTIIEYRSIGDNIFNFNAQNLNNRVFWQDYESSSRELVKGGPNFHAQIDLDASSPSDPQVLAGSFIEIWGEVASFGTGNTLLFTAEIKDLFWTTRSQGIIEFVIDGATMSGSACDLDFCTFMDEVLQFKTNNFNGIWDSEFSKTVRGVSTIPLPTAVWLFSLALLSLGGFKYRRQ